MKAKSKKVIGILAFVLAVILIPLGASAIKNAVSPASYGGGYVQKTVDRINLTVDKTTFVFKKSTENIYNVSFTLTAEKTEADFYAVLNSFSVSGLNADGIFLTANDGATEYVINDTVLPASNGKTEKLTWNVQIPCKMTAAGTLNGTVKIEYTSGITKETADSHLLEIPVTVTVR